VVLHVVQVGDAKGALLPLLHLFPEGRSVPACCRRNGPLAPGILVVHHHGRPAERPTLHAASLRLNFLELIQFLFAARGWPFAVPISNCKTLGVGPGVPPVSYPALATSKRTDEVS